MSLALLFPGQGSQFVGMGHELANDHPLAARIFAEADATLGFSLSEICWEGPEEKLTQTRYAQPAILTHSVAVFRVIEQSLGPVAMAAGHSLGEYSAHVCAGTLNFSDALTSVKLRGELMFRSGQERPGTMAAILGLDDEAVERVCAESSSGSEVCVPANFNSKGQVVISGDSRAVERAMAAAAEQGARRTVQLNVSGAFHSPLMGTAEQGLRAKLQSTVFQDPGFPVVSNVTGAPVAEGRGARDLLIRQLTSPVRWSASIQAMLAAGVDRFLELGPGSVLCGLNRRNARRLPCKALGESEEVEEFTNDEELTRDGA